MKKIIIPIVLVLLIIPFMVYAETCDTSKITVSSISVDSNSDSTEELEQATVDGKSINLNLSMSEVGDYIQYKVLVKNESNDDFLLNDKSFSIESDYIDYSISSIDNSNIVKANSNKEVYLKVEYKKEVPIDEFSSGTFNDKKTVTVNLSTNNIITNPETGVHFLVLVTLISLTLVGLYISIKNNKSNTLVGIIIGIIIIPITTYALCECNISVESNVTIKEKKALLIDGKSFNTVIKQLSANNESINYSAADNNIRHISIATELSQEFNPVEVNNDSSEHKIYTWFNDQTIYLYTPAKKIYLDPDSSSMFYELESVLDIDLSMFDTSMVTNMKDMFWCCKSITNLDLSKFDTSNVTDMFNMFSSCYRLKSLDLSNFNTSNVTTMGCMFWGNYVITDINVSNFDTSKVTEFGSMFSRNYQLTTLDLSSFSSDSAENVSAMFYQDSKLETVYVSSEWDVTNVSGYSSVFNQSKVKSFTVKEN